MYYSHLLLAKKTPLGQIWTAATMRCNISRKKLEMIDIIKTCDEIMNPPVPMALRLTSILMGGVVMVYQKKVKLLYDDCRRLKVLINAEWRMNGDPSVKFEEVTLPQLSVNVDPIPALSVPSSLHLDEVDDYYLTAENTDNYPAGNTHKANMEDITLFDHSGSGIAETTDHLERFAHGDIESHVYMTEEEPEFPRTSPVPQEERVTTFSPIHATNANIQQQHPQQPVRRRVRRNRGFLNMDQQNIIPSNTYQHWLQDTSDIVSKRERTVEQCRQPLNHIRSTKKSTLIGLPPVALVSLLGYSFPTQLHFPAPLMELWRQDTNVNPANSPPGDESPMEQQPEPSPDIDFSAGKLRANLEDFQPVDNTFGSEHFATAGSPAAGQSSRSIHSSGSERMFMPLEHEVDIPSPSARSKRKRTNFGNLDPVEEEFPLHQERRGSKIRRLSETYPTPDSEPTPLPATETLVDKTSVDNITESIRAELKLSFDRPGAPSHQSLCHLSTGMNRNLAAKLFYQICVLASEGFIKVEQQRAYGDISISRGPKL